MDYLSIANSGWMWFAVAIPMAVLAAQVFLLLRRSLKDGKRMGVKEEQIKSAVIASASASVGPSVSILAGMVSLMVMMGAPIAWMRLSYIGAVMFEMTSADVGAQAVGVAFEQSSMTAEAFANGVWAALDGLLCQACLHTRLTGFGPGWPGAIRRHCQSSLLRRHWDVTAA